MGTSSLADGCVNLGNWQARQCRYCTIPFLRIGNVFPVPPVFRHLRQDGIPWEIYIIRNDIIILSSGIRRGITMSRNYKSIRQDDDVDCGDGDVGGA